MFNNKHLVLKPKFWAISKVAHFSFTSKTKSVGNASGRVKKFWANVINC